MEIKKTIKINIDEDKLKFVAYDRMSLGLIMGTSCVEVHLYEKMGLKKMKNKWIIPKKLVKERLKIMKIQRDKLNQKIDIIEQILGLSA